MRHDSFNRNDSHSRRLNGRKPNGHAGRGRTEPAVFRERVQEETLKSGTVQIEQKSFVFTLKENPRGRFLRITEAGKGRHNTIIIPATGLEDIKRILGELVKLA